MRKIPVQHKPHSETLGARLMLHGEQHPWQCLICASYSCNNKVHPPSNYQDNFPDFPRTSQCGLVQYYTLYSNGMYNVLISLGDGNCLFFKDILKDCNICIM